jgi:hypothetical protein
MHYVELMRARRVLIGYGIAQLAIVALTALSMLAGPGHVHTDFKVGSAPVILSSSVITVCMFGALIVATLMIPGLNAEAATTPIIWTRPTPRDTIAWRYVAIDLATIFVAFLATVACAYVVLAIVGVVKYSVFDAKTISIALLGLGTAAMWYGLVSAAAARLPGRGSMLAGLSWLVFVVLGGLTAAPFPALIHVLINALNYLNPLAYFSGINTGNADNLSAMVSLNVAARASVTWLIGLVAIFASVRLWSTREA